MVKLLIGICSLLLMSETNSEWRRPDLHPIYLSVSEIEYNTSAKSLEINCKLFVDDFEKILRKEFQERIDLINPSNRERMNTLVNQYIQNHFKISVNGKPITLYFLGYERMEEGIYSYFEAKDVSNPVQFDIYNTLLYELTPEQMGIMHCKVNGRIKSTKLNHPDSKASLRF